MPARVRTIVLVCALAAAVGGCGSGNDGTIPSGDSENLVGLLDAIESDIASHNCDVVDDHADQFASAVNGLPAEVDDKVKQGLTEASARLIELSKEPGQCESVSGASGPTGTESSTTTTTTTTEPSTTSSSTSTTSTQPEEQSPPQENNNGQGNGPPGGGTGGRSSDSGGLEGGKR